MCPKGQTFPLKQADAEHVTRYLPIEAAEGAVARFENGDCSKKKGLS